MVITGRGAEGDLIDCGRETLVDLTRNSFFLQRTRRIAREAKAARLQAGGFQVVRRGKAAKGHGFMPRRASRAS